MSRTYLNVTSQASRIFQDEKFFIFRPHCFVCIESGLQDYKSLFLKRSIPLNYYYEHGYDYNV